MADKPKQYWDFRVCGWVRHDPAAAVGGAALQAPVEVPAQQRPAVADPGPDVTPVGKPK